MENKKNIFRFKKRRRWKKKKRRYSVLL